MTVGRLLGTGFVLLLAGAGALLLGRAVDRPRPAPAATGRPASPPEAHEPEGLPVAATARGLLRSLPEEVRLDDLRVSWPGPGFSVRMHAPSTGGLTGRLEAWGRDWSGRRAPSGQYDGRFLRFDATPDAFGFRTFEFVLAPRQPGGRR